MDDIQRWLGIARENAAILPSPKMTGCRSALAIMPSTAAMIIIIPSSKIPAVILKIL